MQCKFFTYSYQWLTLQPALITKSMSGVLHIILTIHGKHLCIKCELILGFLKKIWRHKSFLWDHWYPCFGLLVTSPLGFKARVGSLIHTWWGHMCYMFPEIHLWCYTCWPLGSWYGSQAILFHILASRYWWGSKPRPIVPPLTVWDQAGRVLQNFLTIKVLLRSTESIANHNCDKRCKIHLSN